MYYGELAEHSVEYQCGHESGSIRAYDDAISWFQKVLENEKPNTKHTTSEVIAMLQFCKILWIEHCQTFGMASERLDEK